MLKIALIGVGYWGPNLLRNLVKNPDCDLRMVIDISEERRAYVREKYKNINVFKNIDDAIKNDEIDAIVISTPARTHFQLTKSALENGKHVLVEKPMALEVEEVENIMTLSKKNNLVAMVGHTFLYNNAVRYVKTLIDDGEIGKIRYIYSQRLNLGRIRSDVDALWNLAPHDISIIQYWLNDMQPLSVSKQGMDYIQKGIDDVVFLNVSYPDNILVNVHVSWLDPHKVRKIILVGSKKMVVYDDIAEHKVIIYDKGIDRISVLGEEMDFDESTSFQFSNRTGDFEIPQIEFEEPLKTEVQHFIDCIKKGQECLTGPKHAKSVVNILSSAINKV